MKVNTGIIPSGLLFFAMAMAGVPIGGLTGTFVAVAAEDHSDSGSHNGGKAGAMKGGSKSGGEQGEEDQGHSDSHGGKPMDKILQGGGQSAGRGKGGNAGNIMTDKVIKGSASAGESEDSDRPEWAGVKGGKSGQSGKPAGAGSKKGDLYGDLWVILRDENGIPILNDKGFVQPLDAQGNLIPLNDEGEPIDPNLVVEVDFGRLSVARSPEKVLDHAYDEAIKSINTAQSITLDPAGRILLTIDGVQQAIDSPLENLALYKKLLSDGYLPGITLSDAQLGQLTYLKDPTMTSKDMLSAASFLAAAADKTGTITKDTVVYFNKILGIEGTLTGSDGTKYVDFTNVPYDRATTYDGTVSILQKQPDGSYLPTDVKLMDAVFNDTNYVDKGGVDSFAQATNDSLQVIEYIHDNGFEN